MPVGQAPGLRSTRRVSYGGIGTGEPTLEFAGPIAASSYGSVTGPLALMLP